MLRYPDGALPKSGASVPASCHDDGESSSSRGGDVASTGAGGAAREEPEYRLLFGSQVLSILGDRVTMVALPFAVLGGRR